MAQPTIIEVAALAGVSKETVNRVIARSPLLAPETRARVERVIAEIGYVPEQQPRTPALRRSPLVALVHGDADDPHLPSVIAGMTEGLKGSDLLLGIQRFDPDARGLLREFADFLESRRPCGVFALAPLSAIDELGGLCWEFGCGYIAFGGDGPHYAMRVDERGATARLANRLVALGHRRIGYIAGSETDSAMRERELGYLDAMAEHGLDRGPALIAGGDGSVASGITAAGLLLEVSPAPTAIIAASDAMAAGAIRAAQAQRLAVPHDLSIAGFGDTLLAAALSPALTTVRVPLREMARDAALRLLAPDTGVGGRAAWTAEPVERQSTGPAPGAGSDQVEADAGLSAFQSG